MKKNLALLVAAMMAFGLLVGCGAKDNAESPSTSTEQPSTGTEQGQYADGNYFAKGTPDDNGWMYMVQLDVKDGKITAVNWDAANTKTAGDTKKQQSISGEYGMKKGGASSEWHEQAKLMEDTLIEKQDPKKIEVTDEGKTDAVSGVSIHVGDFVKLAEQALAAGPVEKGAYKDGAYKAEGKDFDDQGWKETINVTVFDGQIVAVNWDNVNKEGASKKEQAAAGTYGMNWHEQANNMEAALIEKQDPAQLGVKEDGTTDAVSGVSIHVNGFVKLAEEALQGAK
ncbi:FMN-binding protein [Paenibacillus sp. 1001270B_150601_E10]|uniref:FMN-binding protein n=1 Tax=Paenibacillus sp. 1001270B_150601_E10 TaxID=2787079 RepID=UPI00189D85A2|nr:FMN-binding protein [Paenibacillus sp. 1001270B_150601_E10]